MSIDGEELFNCPAVNLTRIGNGFCSEELNNEKCGYDGGDCCECECETGDYNCGNNDYSQYNFFPCFDPDANRTCETYPGCSGGPIEWIGEGICEGCGHFVPQTIGHFPCTSHTAMR
ncbi:unnamed protein product [Pylaiella littoralis]